MFVCCPDLLAKVPNGICTGFIPQCQAVISSPPKPDPPFRRLINRHVGLAEGSEKKRRFFDFCSFKVRLLWCPPHRNRDRDIPAICRLLGLEVPLPFQGADYRAGPN